MIERRLGSHVAKRFFSSTFNQHALSKPLNYYVEAFRDPKDILKILGINPLSFHLTTKDMLAQMPFNQKKLNLSPIQLVDTPIASPSKKLLNVNDLVIPPSHQKLRGKLIEYSNMLFVVANNDYSKRNYELAEEERENLSEGDHGKQNEKIASLLEMSDRHIVQQRFHDISRCTHPDVNYSNKNHHKESHQILRPLRLDDYSKDHTFGKYLLTQCCDTYKELISPLSAQSLIVQSQQFNEIIHFLRQLPPEEAVRRCLWLTLWRLIDDSGKVASYMLKNDPSKRYYSDDVTLSLVITLLNQIMKNLDISQLEQYMKELEDALKLLHRPASLQQRLSLK